MAHSSGPQRWLDGLIGGCFGVLLASMALYGAVQVVASIWLPLCIGLAVIAAIGLLVALVVWRLRR
jgi:hypothetical protein